MGERQAVQNEDIGGSYSICKSQAVLPIWSRDCRCCSVFSADERRGGIGEGRSRRSIVIRGKIYGNGRNTWI